jgi:hypothetical protein
MNGHVIKPNPEMWVQQAINEMQRNSKFSFPVSLSLEINDILCAAYLCCSTNITIKLRLLIFKLMMKHADIKWNQNKHQEQNIHENVPFLNVRRITTVTMPVAGRYKLW